MNLDVIGYILYSGLGMLILAFLFLLSSMVNKPQKVTHNLYDEAVSDYEDGYEEDSEYEEDEYEEELNTYSPEKERKSIFGIKKHNRKRNYEEDYYHEENMEESSLNNVKEKDYEEDFYEENFNINTSNENYTEEKFNASNPEEYNYEDDGIEDEFESDFEFIESITKKGKKDERDYDLFEEDNYNTFSNNEDEDYNYDKKEIFNIDEDEDDDYSDFDFEENPKVESLKKEEKKGITIKKYEDTYEDLEEDYDVEQAMLKRFKAYKNSIKK